MGTKKPLEDGQLINSHLAEHVSHTDPVPPPQTQVLVPAAVGPHTKITKTTKVTTATPPTVTTATPSTVTPGSWWWKASLLCYMLDLKLAPLRLVWVKYIDWLRV